MPRKTHPLEAVFQMFNILGVDLRGRWQQARTAADLETAWTAGLKDAKSRYRELSRKYHPDVNPDPEAHEAMARLTQLWSVISSLRLNLQPRPQPVKTIVFMNQYGAGTFRAYGTANTSTVTDI